MSPSDAPKGDPIAKSGGATMSKRPTASFFRSLDEKLNKNE